jgi:hypothetical protein
MKAFKDKAYTPQMEKIRLDMGKYQEKQDIKDKLAVRKFLFSNFDERRQVH